MCRSHAHRGSCCEPSGAWQPTHRYEHHHYATERLGVRRPLRFLAWKLELDERQVSELASILNELKTERAQADVDDRRALALLAGAAESETFDRDKATEAARLRSQSAERVQQKVVDSLARMHALLEPEQRARLAYLLRTGTLMM
jgi:Spy/CpxP family protein refolding chaperone